MPRKKIEKLESEIEKLEVDPAPKKSSKKRAARDEKPIKSAPKKAKKPAPLTNQKQEALKVEIPESLDDQKLNIFIHRRDLRCIDNTALNFMSKNFGAITPIFIFTPEQIKPENNEYFCHNLVQFMCESLEDLDQKYQNLGGNLNFFEGDIVQVLQNIHTKHPIQSVGFNADYSPYAAIRDQKIADFCQENEITVVKQEDILLVNILNQKNYPNQRPYEVFTPFMNYQKKTYQVRLPDEYEPKVRPLNLDTKFRISVEKIGKFYETNPNIYCHGGRAEGLKRLDGIKNQGKYVTHRNNLDYETTGLSPYLNLGLVSCRETYQNAVKKFSKDHTLVTELWWRDFFYNILYYFPKNVGNAMNKKFRDRQWDDDVKGFEKWKAGQTGFPIVDACMNQLNTTGFLHNRGRMIVASFLTKHLFTDWRWGEKYFASKLIDCNVAANNGGWQWTASTGVDSHRSFYRVFNPWLQTAKFDENCVYTKKWLPVLKDVPNEHIKKWDQFYKKYEKKLDYPVPICDHKERRENALAKLKEWSAASRNEK